MKHLIFSKYILISFIFSFLLFGCQKETIQPTQAQQTASVLKDIIQSKQIDRVVAVDFDSSPNNFPSSTGLTYSFSNGFITISGFTQSFNLAYLKAYAVENMRWTSFHGHQIILN